MNDPHSYPQARTVVIGVHAIRELLRHYPERLLRLFTVKTKDSEIVKEFEKKRIPVSFTSPEELNRMAGTDSQPIAHRPNQAPRISRC